MRRQLFIPGINPWRRGLCPVSVTGCDHLPVVTGSVDVSAFRLGEHLGVEILVYGGEKFPSVSSSQTVFQSELKPLILLRVTYEGTSLPAPSSHGGPVFYIVAFLVDG